MAIEAGTVQETYQQMKAKLSSLVPDAELRIKAELVFEINRLKRQRGAIILGHNYMEPALFVSVPDVVGDSLELSRRAAATDADPIIFCGVRFMAETAKILNPERTVLLPARRAGCSLAESISADDVRALRQALPGVPVVTYINTYADVKAETDVCCTSGNARRVLESFGDRPVMFLPDEYLARNVAAECGRPVVAAKRTPRGVELDGPVGPNTVIAWKGHCEVHEKFTVDDIRGVRAQFPDVRVLAHPECPPEVVAASDVSSSTSQMIRYVRENPKGKFLILTECSMGDNIIAENPSADVLRMCSIRCPHMNEITLGDVLHALREDETEIKLDADLSARARGSLERMLTL